MKKLCFILLFLATSVWAAKPPVPSAAYDVTVHVSSVRFEYSEGLLLDVAIAGKKYELVANLPANELLALGDYQARLVKDEHKTAYYSEQTYEFRFSDGKPQKFDVAGAKE